MIIIINIIINIIIIITIIIAISSNALSVHAKTSFDSLLVVAPRSTKWYLKVTLI